MRAADPILVSIMLAAASYALFLSRRLWRRQATKLDVQPSVWPWGAPAWRAYRRVTPLLSCVSVVVFAACLALVLSDGGGSASTIAIGVLLVAAAILLVLVPPIVLLNRPRVLVPPHLRTESGLARDFMDRDRQP